LTCSTVYGTMTEKKLNKLCERIRSLREQAGSVRSHKIVSVAKQLGRYRIDTTGGHPQYGTDLRPGRVTIPSHLRPLKRRTTLSILGELEADIFYWREQLRRDKEPPSLPTGEVEQ